MFQFKVRVTFFIGVCVVYFRLSEIVSPPSLVTELSWVHQFWPADHDATTTLSTSGHHNDDSLADVQYEHLRSKPEVSLFCLIGMKDSYTDYHCDFGGSSVWYHCFMVSSNLFISNKS
jgi:hypothetical protein